MRNGEALGGRRPPVRSDDDFKETFWTRLEEVEDQSFDLDTPCLVWTGGINKKGYGTVRRPGRKVKELTHRIAWELTNGPIPKDRVVGHKWDHNKLCCNPEHLHLTTIAENNREAAETRNGVKRYQDKVLGEWEQGMAVMCSMLDATLEPDPVIGM